MRVRVRVRVRVMVSQRASSAVVPPSRPAAPGAGSAWGATLASMTLGPPTRLSAKRTRAAYAAGDQSACRGDK